MDQLKRKKGQLITEIQSIPFNQLKFLKNIKRTFFFSHTKKETRDTPHHTHIIHTHAIFNNKQKWFRTQSCTTDLGLHQKPPLMSFARLTGREPSSFTQTATKVTPKQPRK